MYFAYPATRAERTGEGEGVKGSAMLELLQLMAMDSQMYGRKGIPLRWSGQAISSERSLPSGGNDQEWK